jgi:Mg2+/Co2+ transporter CorB
VHDIPVGLLVGALIFLILVSAFFSASEIALVTLNRYRLRTLATSGHRGARLAQTLLERPDRLLGIILLGNNFANIAASSIATILAIQLYGDRGVAIAAGVLTFVVLVFAEVAPKTLAALHPEAMAYPAAHILRPLLILLYPLVWFTNLLANGLLRLFGVSVRKKSSHEITADELQALVREANILIPESHQDMLLAVLDLEKVTVDDVMVPRGEIEGVDIDADWDDIVETLGTSRYTRLPVYKGNLDNIVGLIHLRKILHLLHTGNLNRESFGQLMLEPFFVPQGTPISTALLNFRANKRRIALVVDEYGDILGLVTLEEILEEIVGDFTTSGTSLVAEIQPQDDGSYLIQGNVTLRELNRQLDWDLPISGPKTVNGLITEYLQDLPEPGTSIMLGSYQVDVIRTRGTSVQVARIRKMLSVTPGIEREH